MTASAQIGGASWSLKTPLDFHVQWPTNALESDRYTFSNNIYHMLVYSNDGAFQVGNTTLPRTEQRFEPDYTNGDIQYQSSMMVPSDTSGVCIFQIHTGDAQSDAFGSTTMMLFWYSTNGGSVYQHSGTQLVTNLVNQWFQVNVDHNMNARIVTVWINGVEVWQNQDNGAGDFYFKDGVYAQDKDSYEMENYVTNILIWTNLTTNPFPGFYQIQNVKSALAACVRGAFTTNGAAIVQSNFVGSANSLWYLVPTDSGYYRIMNVNSGLALTVQNAATTNRAPIVQWPYNAGGSGDWMPAQTNSTGSYTFTNRLSAKALDVPSTSQNTQFDQTNLTSSTYQQWLLIPYGSIATNRVFVPPLNPAITNGPTLQLNLSGIPSASYVVQATTNLAPPNWQPIFTNVADAYGNFTYTNTNTAAPAARFYRSMMP